MNTPITSAICCVLVQHDAHVGTVSGRPWDTTVEPTGAHTQSAVVWRCYKAGVEFFPWRGRWIFCFAVRSQNRASLLSVTFPIFQKARAVGMLGKRTCSTRTHQTFTVVDGLALKLWGEDTSSSVVVYCHDCLRRKKSTVPTRSCWGANILLMQRVPIPCFWSRHCSQDDPPSAFGQLSRRFHRARISCPPTLQTRQS